jgi:hypothetical protein
VAEVSEPADAETVLIVYLRNLLEQQPGFGDVQVLGAMSASSPGYEPPAEAVTVRLTGGAPLGPAADSAQLTLTAWAAGPEDDIRASDIIRRSVGLVRAAPRLMESCRGVQELSTPYLDPEPVTGRARYSATLALALRGQIIQT